MLGLLDLLRTTALDEEQRGHVAALGEAAEALLRMAEEALTLARIDAGAAPAVASAPCELPAVLHGVVRTLGPVAATRGVMLDVVVDAEVPAVVHLDAGALRQLLLNLVGNALRYTRRGSVRVRARRAHDGETAALALDVVDTGPGLTPAQRGRLFHAWERPLDGDTGVPNGGESGVGLGLVLADALATRLGGRLEVASVHGAGSTFTLVLPSAVTLPATDDGPRVNSAAAPVDTGLQRRRDRGRRTSRSRT
jgi:signal transduction histidine kinase